MGPVHRGLQGLLPAQGRAPAPGEQPEAVAQARGELLRGEHPHPRGGQLEREGDAVQAARRPRPRPGRWRSVRAKAGCAARARSTNRRPAPDASSAAAPAARVGVGQAQGGHAPGGLPGDAQQLAAGGQHPHPGAAAEQGVRQAGSGLEQVLAVVQQEQEPAGGAGAPPTLAAAGGPGRPPPRRPRRRGRRRAPARRRPAGPARRTTPRRGSASMASAAACKARRVLPLPPGPVRVTRRVRAPAGAATAASSRSRPTKLVSCRGRLLGRASRVRRGGNSSGRPGAVSWNTRSGRCRSFSRCSPRSSSPARAGRASRTRTAAAWESTTCPPWAVAIEPRAAVQRGPEVVGALALHLPRVQPHARPEGARPTPPQSSRRRARCPARAAATASVGGAKAA